MIQYMIVKHSGPRDNTSGDSVFYYLQNLSAYTVSVVARKCSVRKEPNLCHDNHGMRKHFLSRAHEVTIQKNAVQAV